MKTLIVIFCLFFTGIAVNAQLYMGGDFEISTEQVRRDNGDKRTTDFTFGAYCDLGYRLTDAWDLGVYYGGKINVYTNHTSNTDYTSAHWLISPYARYKVVQAGNFDFMAKASMALQGTRTYTNFGIRLVPVMAYNLSDRIALQTNLNFLGFGIAYNKVKDGDATTSFNLMGNSNNVATLGNITLGFIYKF